MTTVLHTENLTKMYGQNTALTDANLDIPQGKVVGLVGPNGAGKSTLLGMTCGLIAPTSGVIKVLGNRPASNSAQLSKVGFVAQDTPVYAGLSIEDHLKLGAHLNKTWDQQLAQRRIKQVGLNPKQKAGRLSGGQKAQLALTIAAAKRPELLIFDEPVAALDPLARNQFMVNLMEFVSELNVTVILSSHLISDLERVCDYLILLASSQVQLAGEVDKLLAQHQRLAGARSDFDDLPADVDVITADHRGSRDSVLIVRNPAGTPIPGTVASSEPVDLEDMVIAYMTRAANPSASRNFTEKPLEAQR
jgi:ABC-2 type transport system ATP-binding protein